MPNIKQEKALGEAAQRSALRARLAANIAKVRARTAEQARGQAPASPTPHGAVAGFEKIPAAAAPARAAARRAVQNAPYDFPKPPPAGPEALARVQPIPTVPEGTPGAGLIPADVLREHILRTGGTQRGGKGTGKGVTGGAVQILAGSYFTLKHTNLDKYGRRCHTARWIESGFLVYLGDLARDTQFFFGLSGPGFRCYYPGSGKADYERFKDEASTGRLLHQWVNKRDYVRF
jgi:hypothetical protein